MIKTKFSLFIFDFDGTLVDSRLHIANSVNYALNAEKFPTVKPELIYPTIGKKPIGETFAYLFPKLTDIQREILTEKFRNYLLSHAKQELSFYPNVYETLTELRRRNKRLAILTTKKLDSISSILTSLKIDSLFDVIYGSGMASGNKPDKGCILYLSKKTKTALNETVMVGDTSIDALTATNAGVKSIGVTYGIDGEEGINNGGFSYVITDFKSLLEYT